jgi:hypothetical protein
VTFLYFPATHAAHKPPLAPVNPRLQRQLVNRLVPMSDIEFNGQFMQLEDAVAPTTTEYVLTAQSMHVVDELAPDVGEYLPASQSVQELAVEAPVVVRCFPAAHSVHPTEPMVSLYFPAAHATHASPSGPVYPRLQRQLVESGEPLAD